MVCKMRFDNYEMEKNGRNCEQLLSNPHTMIAIEEYLL